MTHIDDAIYMNTLPAYASDWFASFRRPAIEKLRMPNERKLFATWKGKRYRVTGCSRMGGVWLHSNFEEDTTYEHRVDVDECSDWSEKP